MTLAALTGEPGVLWLAVALVLGIGEIVVPGVFLIFLAIAAAITGLATLVLADLPVPAQLLSFAVWSVVTVLIGRRWYRDYPQATADPHLNDRGARLIGQTVTVTQAIANGTGRVGIGDGEWIAHGADAAAGAHVRIAAVAGNAVVVEPIAAIRLP